MSSSNELKSTFYDLTPDIVLDGAEFLGFQPTGEYIQLNSYENRVFEVRLEPNSSPELTNDRVILKFYRPGRWSFEAIKEEHDFLLDLKTNGITVVAPLLNQKGDSLSVFNGMHLVSFEKIQGRMPQELFINDFEQIGRSLAQIHNIGSKSKSLYRPTLSAENFGWDSLDILQEFVPPDAWNRYEDVASQLIHWVEPHLDNIDQHRIHGDCHRGNLLLRQVTGLPEIFNLIDFDDFCTGPAVQDFWMLLSQDHQEDPSEINAIIRGYQELRDFDRHTLDIIPGLRALRIIHYAAWIAKRWDDPTFPDLFPTFEEYSFWAKEIEALEKIAIKLW